jgi:hypothetical protein
MSNGKFQFAISLSVLNHLGRNLYRNFVTVIGEAISNSWDANATDVKIDIDRENDRFRITDDGAGMTAEHFQGRFLKIGYSKRKEFGSKSDSGRPFIGAKGIGKLAMLSCAERVSVFSRVQGGEIISGVIDNTGLDKAITNDLVPSDYPVEEADASLIEDIVEEFEHGTIIVFQGLKENMRNSEEHIRKIIALSFRFALLDENFTIYLNGEVVGISDLSELLNNTQFEWVINGFKDSFTSGFNNLARPSEPILTKFPVRGFIATVDKPSNLKIRGLDERASVDLFVNGRLREKNILRHIPTQRIVESYIYGQIHFDKLDAGDEDPFTSSREGVMENDLRFKSLLDYLSKEALPKIIDDWDKFRLELGRTGDDENTKNKSKKHRKAKELFDASAEDYAPGKGAPGGDLVTEWLGELADDAEFNVSAYSDCFISENLVRKYIKNNAIKMSDQDLNKVNEYRNSEKANKGKANIGFDIRRDDDDLSYCDMDRLAISAEGKKNTEGPSLWLDAIAYKPARNAVGHTGVLSGHAKSHLSLTMTNIIARVRALLKLNDS